MSALEVAEKALIPVIFAGVIYWLYAILCVARFFRGHEIADIPSAPPVSILKPVKGLDPGLKDNLESFCDQDYPVYEILVGVAEETDPALSVAREMKDLLRSGTMRTVVGRKNQAMNLKVANLMGLSEAARYPLLAVSDSDMKVDRKYLKSIVGEYLSDEAAGMVTSLYKISRPESPGAALESLALALDFIPSVLVARGLEGMTFGLGASMLVSKGALDEIGGFASVADNLADDYHIGNKLSRKGYKIVLSRYLVEDVVGRMSIREHLVHQIRWARTYRTSRPWGYLGYGITHVFPFSLAFLLVHGLSPLSLSLVGTVLFLRACVGLSVGQRVIGSRRWLKWLALVPMKDLLAFGIWVWSFMGRKVYWRGRYFAVTRDGKIEVPSRG